MPEQMSDFYEFGRFRVKSDERLLLRGEELVPLTPKAFDILLALLENDGRIVNKDDLMKKVWPNTFVEEGNLTQNVDDEYYQQKREQACNCTETHCQQEFHSSGDLLRRDHRESLHNH